MIRRARALERSTGAILLNLPPGIVPSFKFYAEHYCAWHEEEYPDSHPRILQIIKDHLSPYFGSTRLNLIKDSQVTDYRKARKEAKPVKTGTLVKEIRTLKAILNHAVEEGRIRSNPIEYTTAPRILDSKPHRFYEAAELARLYKGCGDTLDINLRRRAIAQHAAIWRLYANTGMRRMEGLNLRKQWVGKQELKIISTGEERTKSGQWREIPLSAGANQAIEELQTEGDFVLPRMTPPSLSRAFVIDAKRVELDGSLHTLRHTYVSHLVRAGVPLRTVQLYAGHAHYSTTEAYAYLSPGQSAPQALSLSL